MTRIGLSITKRVVFRDSTQEFSNIYYYASPEVSEAKINDGNNLLDELIPKEREMHSTLVTFVNAKAWSADGGPRENEMLVDRPLSGTGTSFAQDTDPERAFLVMWRAGKNRRGKPVYLRKWYHAVGVFNGAIGSLTTAVLAQKTGFTATERTAIANQADKVTRLGNLKQWGLVSEKGRERDGGPPTAHRYYEHHQLGNQWRG